MTSQHVGADQYGGSVGQSPTVDAARRLLDDLDGQRRRESAAYASGYRDGHRTGWEVGYGHAHHEMARDWAAVAKPVRQLGTPGSVAHEELQRRRSEPGGPAYEAALRRRGGREYKGGPVAWETGQPIRRSA